MLWSTKTLRGFVLNASDGDMGRVKDFLFDDGSWTVRYVVADTGKWLPNRKVLLSPMHVGHPDPFSQKLEVRLTKREIEEAPPLESNLPVSRQYEALLHEHYDVPAYWLGTGLWGLARTPYDLRREGERVARLRPEEMEGDPRLRSTVEVTGYHIEARDGEIGHIETFLVDQDTWSILYMVVDTTDWLPGGEVLLRPSWVERFEWSELRARVDLTKEQVAESPDYDPSRPLDRGYETKLHRHYDRRPYWTEE